VFATSPTLVTPVLGTPASGNLANCTFPTLNQNTTGNAATATNATNLVTADFTVQQSGSDLVFLFGATRIAKLTSAGVFSAIQVAGNDTI
jgi:hypothetical protein